MIETTDIPNISVANTKKELLEYYEAANKGFDSVNKDLLDAEKAHNRLENKEAATADSEAAQDPVKHLHELHGAISRDLTDLAERFENERDFFPLKEPRLSASATTPLVK